MYEKSSLKYRTVIHYVNDNKIRFLWTYRHFQTPYVCIKKWRKNADSGIKDVALPWK